MEKAVVVVMARMQDPLRFPTLGTASLSVGEKNQREESWFISVHLPPLLRHYIRHDL